MLERLSGCDWKNIFEHFSVPSICSKGHSHGVPEPVIVSEVSASPFTTEDVVEIIAISDGEYWGQDWIGVFRLKDGRFVSIKACTSTTWCYADEHDREGLSLVSNSKEELIRFGLSCEDRRRLNLLLEEEKS